MTITFDLPKRIEAKLREKAKSKGQEVDDFVKELVERELLPPWEELVKPVHERTRELGLSEKDVEDLIDKEVAEVRKEKPLWSR